MILDLARFVSSERPHWTALEKTLDWFDANPGAKPSLEELERFHVLYQRVSADLAKVSPLAAEGELRTYLEWLVSRAYAEIHEVARAPPVPALAMVHGRISAGLPAACARVLAGGGADRGRQRVRSAGAADRYRGEDRS